MFRGWLSSKFSPQALEDLFEEYFGALTLRDLSKPTVIATYDADQEGLYLFRNYEAKSNDRHNFYLKDIARATSAAPTYFPAANIKGINGETHLFVDGGVVANNPSMHAYEESKILHPDASWQVISLGTGSSNLFTLGTKSSGGILQWATDIPGVLLGSSSKVIDDLAAKSTKRSGDTYIRLQFELDTQVDKLDNAEPKNINRLKGYVKRKIEEKDPILLKIKKQLLDFYKDHEYYVFYPLVDLVRQQLRTEPGHINLSNCCLSERVLWEITHALRTSAGIKVSHLNLRNNDLSTLSASSLVYLNQLNGLEFLDLSNTNLTIGGLQKLKSVKLALQTLIVCQNPALEEAKDDQLAHTTEDYATIYFDPNLHYRLGGYYQRQGEEARAIKLYSDCKNPTSQLALAELYFRKSPDDPAFDKGFKIIQDLADQGETEAQYMLGHFYHKPDKEIYAYMLTHGLITQGVGELELEQLSLYKAEKWYKMATDANMPHKNAAMALAQLYEDGKIVVPIPAGEPRDERHQIKQALYYYKKAQEAGSETAFRNVQRLTEKLESIIQDS